MSVFDFEGKIFYCEDYTNTDVMAPGRYDPIYEEEELAKIALIDYAPIEPFVNSKTSRSDFSVIVAGEDFGCGSSRETAPMALAAAGVRVVVAKSFARIFFRNCVNMGKILPLVIPHDCNASVHGQLGKLAMKQRKLWLAGQEYSIPPLGVVEDILACGGLAKAMVSGQGVFHE